MFYKKHRRIKYLEAEVLRAETAYRELKVMHMAANRVLQETLQVTADQQLKISQLELEVIKHKQALEVIRIIHKPREHKIYFEPFGTE